MKTGGSSMNDIQYYYLLLLESHLTLGLFGSMLREIAVPPSQQVR